MDKQTISQRLAFAESQVHRGDVRVNRQRTLVKHLERHGLGTLQARRLLRELEDTQDLFIADRDQLKSEMAESAAGQAGATERQPSSPTISADS